MVQNTQTGMYTAYFGYTGNANPPVTIPAGTQNYVDAAAVLLGNLPTTFSNTAQHMIFSLTFSSAITPA